MKRTLLAAILATAAIAFSCTMEEPVKSDSVVFNPTATVTDFVLDGATKTTLSVNENNVTFAFNDDDILRIYPLNPTGDGLRFTVKENKGTSCVFDGAGFGLFEGQAYAAFYPGGDEIVPDATAVPVDYTGQALSAKEAWDLSAVDYLVASVPAVEGACSFTMKHVGALLVLDVTFAHGGTYTELTLSSDENEFGVGGTIDLTADEIAVDCDEFDSEITLALGGADGISVEEGETVRFFMMIAPSDMSGCTIKMTLTDGDDEISTEFEGKNYQAGKAYKVLGSPVEEPLGDPIDLSANGTANSYIVSEKGYYSIDVKAIGNGEKKSVAFGSRDASMVYPEWTNRNGFKELTGDGVEVTLNQNNCVSNVSYEEGKFFFKATGKEGIAKLTLTYGGENVWTWVIWCTDAPADLAFTIDGVTYHIMDRNLGAFSDGSVLPASLDEVTGLYYQFGNPLGYTWEEFENGVFAQMNKTATMKNALADNPNRPNLNCTYDGYHPDPPYEPYGDFHWFWVYDFGGYAELLGKFWGGGSKTAEDQVAGSNRLKRGNEASKTVYDPCPVGYKVMGHDTFMNYTAVTSGNAFGVYVPVDNGENIFIPYNGYGWTIEYGLYGAGRGPAPITMDGISGPYASLWTSGHNGKNMGFVFAWVYDRTTGSGKFTYEYLSKEATDDQASSIAARGLGVRCILDEF